MSAAMTQPTYKCLECGRDKFQRPNQPHVCNKNYRKHSFPKGFEEVFTVDVICAWCGESLGTKPGFTSPEPTHGICPECVKKEGVKNEVQKLRK